MKTEFVGKKARVEYVQEVGWRRPTRISFGGRSYGVRRVLARWEEHTLSRPWWRRKHRVWYEVELEDGHLYHLYWDRGGGAKGRDWFVVKRLVSRGLPRK